MTWRIVADAFSGVTLHPLTTPVTTELTCCRPDADWVRMPSTVCRKATRAPSVEPEPEPVPAGPRGERGSRRARRRPHARRCHGRLGRALQHQHGHEHGNEHDHEAHA